MFDRKKYKQFALIQLKKRWVIPVVMTLVSSIIFFLFQLPSAFDVWNSGMFTTILNAADPWETYRKLMNNYEQPVYLNVIDVISTLAGFVIVFAQILVYLKMSHGPQPVHFSDFIDGFASWWHTILAGLWQTLWIILWTCLFIVPGIVKSFAYSQTYFLIAEYPNMSVEHAMRISTLITNGYKRDLFVLDLSFIGWALICSFTGGIGFLWLTPYFSLTLVNAYHGLVKQALESHLITMEDLTQ